MKIFLIFSLFLSTSAMASDCEDHALRALVLRARADLKQSLNDCTRMLGNKCVEHRNCLGDIAKNNQHSIHTSGIYEKNECIKIPQEVVRRWQGYFDQETKHMDKESLHFYQNTHKHYSLGKIDFITLCHEILKKDKSLKFTVQ